MVVHNLVVVCLESGVLKCFVNDFDILCERQPLGWDVPPEHCSFTKKKNCVLDYEYTVFLFQVIEYITIVFSTCY